MRYCWIILPLTLLSLACSPAGPPGNEACGAALRATSDPEPSLAVGTEIVMGFYNVENLFDTLDDPANPGDNWVIEEPAIGFAEGNYRIKLQNLAKAIASIEGQGPDLLGLAEVENACVIADLIAQPPLATRGYRLVHEESNDHRGIDVALMYDPEYFAYRSHFTRRVDFSDPDYTGRDILVVEGLVNGETIYVLVNHWPSRSGGQQESEPRRIAAAQAVRQVVDELNEQAPEAGLVIMGDFNDDPADPSLTQVLQAQLTYPEAMGKPGIYNLFAPLHDPEREGSLTYRGRYNLFDQVLLNEDLLDGAGALGYVSSSATIHHPDFMRFRGGGPSRSIHRGEFKDYGFSDHFPVYLKLEVQP